MFKLCVFFALVALAFAAPAPEPAPAPAPGFLAALPAAPVLASSSSYYNRNHNGLVAAPLAYASAPLAYGAAYPAYAAAPYAAHYAAPLYL